MQACVDTIPQESRDTALPAYFCEYVPRLIACVKHLTAENQHLAVYRDAFESESTHDYWGVRGHLIKMELMRGLPAEEQAVKLEELAEVERREALAEATMYADRRLLERERRAARVRQEGDQTDGKQGQS